MEGFNWKDTLNLISKLTFKRAWNGAKVLTSFYATRLLNKPIQWGYPVSISFEPTTSCNLRCPECPSGLRAFTRPTGMFCPAKTSEGRRRMSKYRCDPRITLCNGPGSRGDSQSSDAASFLISSGAVAENRRVCLFAGSFAVILRISLINPMSSIRSASSRTRYSTLSR